ncbi:MAG: 2-enoyl thioester reductase domain-containing protein [Verrucomicrobiota bacterium JB022]|nr:2-enoyl thioester reductase domain-containing protein [Verrucomicrobiota bacterium JB022]
MESSLAITYHEHGKPLDVLRLEEITLPRVGPQDVKVKLLKAVINPSDFGMILGNYGRLAELPAVAGREGVGEIIEVGSEVTHLRVGDRVRFPEEFGAWRTATVVQAKNLWKVPQDVDVSLAAMAWVNPPTSWRILRDANIHEGSWIVQNAANSAVGIFTIQMAKYLGLKTLNVVRREELIEPLTKMGADVVVTEDSGYEKNIKELTNGGQISLALNSVGGESAIRLVKALSRGGMHVTFGAMTFEDVRWPTRFLIFNDITIKGFWLDRWYRDNSPERIQVMFDNLFNLMRTGVISAPISASYKLEDFKQALEASTQPKLGKVLLEP